MKMNRAGKLVMCTFYASFNFFSFYDFISSEAESVQNNNAKIWLAL